MPQDTPLSQPDTTLPQPHPAGLTPDMFEGIVWRDVLGWGLEGQGWREEHYPFIRLPMRVKTAVRPELWQRALHPAGLSTRFKTDAVNIFARWTLGEQADGNPVRTHLGMAGLDCYGRDDGGPWRWVGFGSPWTWPVVDSKLNKAELDGKLREYRVYLPLHQPVQTLEIGVHERNFFAGIAPQRRRPIVFYGTSIVHGTCSTRPGMTHVAILQRRLDRPVLNLGFGGQGRMDPPIVELLAEVDAALYVIDCLPNMDPDDVRASLPVLVRILRAKRPETPILFVGDRLFGDGAFIPLRREEQQRKSAAQRDALQRLHNEGVRGLHLLDAQNFFGDDFEGTTDGSHPSDLGYMRFADILEPTIRGLLDRASGTD